MHCFETPASKNCSHVGMSEAASVPPRHCPTHSNWHLAKWQIEHKRIQTTWYFYLLLQGSGVTLHALVGVLQNRVNNRAVNRMTTHKSITDMHNRCPGDRHNHLWSLSLPVLYGSWGRVILKPPYITFTVWWNVFMPREVNRYGGELMNQAEKMWTTISTESMLYCRELQ